MFYVYTRSEKIPHKENGISRGGKRRPGGEFAFSGVERKLLSEYIR